LTKLYITLKECFEIFFFIQFILQSKQILRLCVRELISIFFKCYTFNLTIFFHLILVIFFIDIYAVFYNILFNVIDIYIKETRTLIYSKEMLSLKLQSNISLTNRMSRALYFLCFHTNDHFSTFLFSIQIMSFKQ